MRKLIVVLMMLSASQIMAKYIAHEGSLDVVASTEEEAIAKAQAALPGIRNMTNREVIREGSFNNCSFRRNRINPKYKFLIRGVKLTKLYKITDNQIIEPYYMASVKYMFRHCRDSD